MHAFVSFPDAPLTQSLVKRALITNFPDLRFVDSLLDAPTTPLLQWSTYDAINHDWTLALPDLAFSSSYIIRKALIRKHYLHRAIQGYTAKNHQSILAASVPETWDLDIAFADELDELWCDDLYDLSLMMDENPDQWYLLKPGMADRGMGIRIFSTKLELTAIFEEIDAQETVDDEQDDVAPVLSQLRNFVIQKYVPYPVLFDPRQHSKHNSRPFVGHKFHLRVYCVASGALEVFFYTRILALFASRPWHPPGAEGISEDDFLAAHLTNTSLHSDFGHKDDFVHLLSELEHFRRLDGSIDEVDSPTSFNQTTTQDVISQISEVLAEVFDAAVANPVHFMPLPNAFELFGVDFLVSQVPSPSDRGSVCVSLLEFNAEPAIEMTGPRLGWILEGLFDEVTEHIVVPLVTGEKQSSWDVGAMKGNLLKCYAKPLR